MGVPVVTMWGKAPASRVGHSLLRASGLEQLCAASVSDYVRVATDLAADLTALAELKAGLRSRIAASELGDCAGLARSLERAYRGLWQEWIAKPAK
jgi:predicted O-linked N-acetylglucosamine transferase (SPINDLY family)